MTKLTQEKVHQLLDYDPETGELKWKVARGNRKMGAVAGSVGPDGYRQIEINRKNYRGHRLAWLWWYGYFPENDIDHINRVRSDNRLSNLREVSRTCNSRNCVTRSKSRSEVNGVFWDEKSEKWRSSIMVASKAKCLGRHKDLVEAVAHRLAAEQCLNWEGCDSSSSAYQYMNSIRRQHHELHKYPVQNSSWLHKTQTVRIPGASLS